MVHPDADAPADPANPVAAAMTTARQRGGRATVTPYARGVGPAGGVDALTESSTAISRASSASPSSYGAGAAGGAAGVPTHRRCSHALNVIGVPYGCKAAERGFVPGFRIG